MASFRSRTNLKAGEISQQPIMKDCRLHNKEQRALAILDTMTRAPNPMLPIVDLVEMPLTLQKALDPHASQTSTIRMPYYENGGADGPGIQRSLRLKPL